MVDVVGELGGRGGEQRRRENEREGDGEGEGEWGAGLWIVCGLWGNGGMGAWEKEVKAVRKKS